MKVGSARLLESKAERFTVQKKPRKLERLALFAAYGEVFVFFLLCLFASHILLFPGFLPSFSSSLFVAAVLPAGIYSLSDLGTVAIGHQLSFIAELCLLCPCHVYRALWNG